MIHFALCTCYDGLPATWDWYIIHILGTILCCLFGEYLCSRRELDDIPLLQLWWSCHFSTRDLARKSSTSFSINSLEISKHPGRLQTVLLMKNRSSRRWRYRDSIAELQCQLIARPWVQAMRIFCLRDKVKRLLRLRNYAMFEQRCQSILKTVQQASLLRFYCPQLSLVRLLRFPRPWKLFNLMLGSCQLSAL